MGLEPLQEGFRRILNGLFNRQALYERARGVLDRVDVHIFRGKTVGIDEQLSAFLSFIHLGLRGENGWLDRDYFGVLRHALRLDRKVRRLLGREVRELRDFWEGVAPADRSYIELDEYSGQRFGQMIEYAHEALVRGSMDRELGEIRDFVRRVQEAVDRGRVELEQGREVYGQATRYLETKMKLNRFPGIHLIKAFELCIVGSHYRIVVENVLSRRDTDALRGLV